MDFVKIPNLPLRPVGLMLVDGRISRGIEGKLISLEIGIIKTFEYKGIYEAVSYHPDMIMHHLGENRIVFAPGTHKELLDILEKHGFELIEGKTRLTAGYPGNIAYNVARIGNLALHNTKYTDPILRDELENLGVQLLNVNQGYTKCSISVVDEKSIITSDKGIAKVAALNGIETLLIEPDDNILLPGLKNGFIGGSTGLVNIDTWAVTGDFGLLKSSKEIKRFLDKKERKIVSLSNEEIYDFGSLIPLKTK